MQAIGRLKHCGLVFPKHLNVCCRICQVQHSNSGSTNGVSLGRGCVFIRPIAEREECSGNLFEKNSVAVLFGTEITLV